MIWRDLTMYINCSEKTDLKPRFDKTYLVYKRTKQLFHVNNFVPDGNECKQTTIFNQGHRESHLFHSFKRAYKNLKMFHFFPIIHAKVLTKEQIAGLMADKEYMIQQVSEEEVNEVISAETGRERLRKMFSKDIRGEWSDEVKFIWPTSIRSAAFAFLPFYVLKFKELREEFVRANRAATFYSNYMAGRKIRDIVNMGALKHGAKWAGRIFVLVFTLLLVSQTIAAYRNKSSPWEYIIGTGVSGGVSRFFLGPKGMISGFIFGAVLGAPFGVGTYYLLKANGYTQEENHFRAVRECIGYHKKLKGEIKLPPVADVKSTEK